MRKKIILVLLLMLFFPLVLNAYEIKMEWMNNMGGNSHDRFEGCQRGILQTSDGGFLTYFDSESTNIEGITSKGYEDAIIVKHDKDGNVEWQTSWGGTDRDRFHNILQTDDDGFIAVGQTFSKDIYGIENYGTTAAIIVKYDKAGNVEWQKSWSIEKQQIFTSISLTSDGEFLVVGQSSESDRKDAVIVKYDKNGNMIWQKYWGGNSNDYFYNIFKTEDDGFIAVGWSKSTDIEGLTYLGGYQDAVTVKYDKDGNMLWQKNWGGNDQDQLYSVSLTSDGGFIAVGSTASKDIEDIEIYGSVDAVIVKFDKDGNVLCQNSWGGNKSDVFHSILHLKDGGFIAVGRSESTDIEGLTNKGGYGDAIIVIFDRDLNVVSQKMLGGSNLEGFYSIFYTLDGGFIAMGQSSSTDIEGLGNNGGLDVMIIKYSFEYNLENTSTENGTSTVERQGKYGIITPTPNDGYEIDKIIVKDTAGNEISVTVNSDGTYTFELYDDVSVEVLFKEMLVNPKTGVSGYIGAMFTIFIIGICAFFMIRNCNNSYEL